MTELAVEQTMLRAARRFRRRHLRRLLSAVCVSSAALSIVPVCTAQQVIEGTHGARLIQWPMNGRITSMAVSDEGNVVVSGLTAVDLGAGQVGFAPILWFIEQSGGVQPTILPTLTATSASNTGWVNGISRNGHWAGGWTPSAEVAAGTLWNINDPAMPHPVGLTVADDHGLLTAAGSSIVAVSNDGTSFGVGVEQGTVDDYGFVQRPGEDIATMLPSLLNARGASGNLHPTSTSRDGTIVVGEVPRADALTHAAFWRAGEEFAQPLFEDDQFSSAFAVSPNGRYAGGYVVHGGAPGAGLPTAFIKDLQSQEVIFLVDQFSGPWPSPVIDISDDGRIAVGDANVFLDYSEYTSDVGFIAIDGVAQTFSDWLADGFALEGLSFEVVRAVHRHGDRYHFVAQAGNNASWAGTAYYISIPVSSIFAPLLTGDFSGDGVVDAADYVVWRDQLGANHTPTDYDAWRANFGHSTGNGADVVSAVPEPASIVLAAIAFVALFRPRWVPLPLPRSVDHVLNLESSDIRHARDSRCPRCLGSGAG